MWGEGGLGELASGPLHPRLTDSVNALAFDPVEEALWAGTEGGLVCQVLCPGIEPYSAFPSHQVRSHGGRLCLGRMHNAGFAACFPSGCSLAWHRSRRTLRSPAARSPVTPCSLFTHCPLPLPHPPRGQDRVIELRALGEATVSISSCDLSVHASGGLQRLSWADEVRRRWRCAVGLLRGATSLPPRAGVRTPACVAAQPGDARP